MPAAAVIPAPIAYIKVVAVKKLVVGSRVGCSGPVGNGNYPPRVSAVASLMVGGCVSDVHSARAASGTLRWVAGGTRLIYFEKIRVFKAGKVSRLNHAAWNNGIGSRVHFCWSQEAR